MGYMHIDNLYKNQDILMFKECYALEKIHGTSAHISFKNGNIIFFSGGEKHERFIKLFDEEELKERHEKESIEDITFFGEAYGGKQQGMSETYGKELKFIVFDVKIGDCWLKVPDAEELALKYDFEFVSYLQYKTTIKTLDLERDSYSVQAYRNGMGKTKMKEGIVLRPLVELRDNRGNRIISKHKRDEFKETSTKREVSPEKLKVIEDAQKIAKEWVTLERLKHVLDKTLKGYNIEQTGDVIKSMVGDIYREAKGEIIEGNPTSRAIAKETALLYKKYLSKNLK